MHRWLVDPRNGFLKPLFLAASRRRESSTRLVGVPTLKDYLRQQREVQDAEKKRKRLGLNSTSTMLSSGSFDHAVPAENMKNGSNSSHSLPVAPLKYFIETYGCQMNVSDSEIVNSVLASQGHEECSSLEEADVVLTNTCAIRENAESKVWHRLEYFRSLRAKNRKVRKKGYPLVGVLGCMAERLRDKLLEEDSVDFVCGPDAYRDIPRLINNVVSTDQKDSNIRLSLEETYADISPTRQVSSHSAFVSIMRGCNNMCSFCVVPFTRGRERSRPLSSVLKEVQDLSDQGVKEVVLLGQNVNGYHDTSEESMQLYPQTEFKATAGFNNLFKGKVRQLPGARFSDILRAVAAINPEMRVRFTSPHPKDFPDDVLEAVATIPNICKSIHMPLQSGSSTTLARMRRGYSKEAFLELVRTARSRIPGVSLSTDVIAGFCDETEEEHLDTLAVLREVCFDQAFMFAYSLREKTHAARTMEDNVSDEVKQRRLEEIIDAFRSSILVKNKVEETGRLHLVLVEGHGSKSSPQYPILTGRTDTNKRVIFPAIPVLQTISLETVDAAMKKLSWWSEESGEGDVFNYVSKSVGGTISNRAISDDTVHLPHVEADEMLGKYVVVKIVRADSTTLRALPLFLSSLVEFDVLKNSDLLKKLI